jgi:hypothetical protein
MKCPNCGCKLKLEIDTAQVVLPQEKFERPLAETMEAEKRVEGTVERVTAYRARRKREFEEGK